MSSTTASLGLAVVCLALTACGNPADVTIYEPGVYKGPPDPLVAKMENGELAPELRERLELSQTDR